MSLDDRYDPSEIGDRRKSVHISKKDLAWLLVALVIILTFALFGFTILKRQAESSVCLRNMRQISLAISLYLEANNDRFPPAYAFDGDGNVLFEKGYPITWVTLVQENMNKRSSFQCPSASDEELTKNRSPIDPAGFVYSSYGYYLPRAFYELGKLSRPSEAVLIAETSNRGANETFDPLPLTGADGKPIAWDGFVIDWDNANDEPNELSRFVTRLAFSGTAKGVFNPRGSTRHPEGIHVIHADGSAATIKPDAAKMVRIGDEIVGLWAAH